ncbi:MAG: DUF2254 domain-containing protein [Granulosicoccus sp.]
MYVHLIKALNDLRASYWFVPFCMLFSAIALAVLTCWLDMNSAVEMFPQSSFLMASGTDGARTILSVVASAVMGVAGVTFSITIVAVSFASSNFGPRLIGNFMRDRGNQFTLGTFIGTFAYCLIVLASVHDASVDAHGNSVQPFVPYISVLTSLVLALGCIGVLIYYIHHIAETINIENIIADIGKRLKLRIIDIYPDADASNSHVGENSFSVAAEKLQLASVGCESIGYVQAIDHEKLVKLTKSHQILTRVHYRPGDFVTPHDCLLSIWSKDTDTVPVDELRDCFATGPQRTEHQNVLFLVEQLAEVIARALSPGVNDPFTAISCLNWYYLAIVEYVKANPEVVDKQPMERRIVQIAPVTFDRLTSVMFDTTRQYIVSDLNALLHTMAMLAECAWHSGSGVYHQTLVDYLTQYQKAGLEAHDCPVGINAIKERYEQSLSILADTDSQSRYRYEIPWFGGSA